VSKGVQLRRKEKKKLDIEKEIGTQQGGSCSLGGLWFTPPENVSIAF